MLIKKKIVLHTVVFFFIILLLFFILILIYHIINSQRIIDDITNRFDEDKLTFMDKIRLDIIYCSMITGGKIFYPEASKILQHYLYGNGSSLYLKSKYFKNSLFIKNALKKYKDKDIGPITLHIKDNPRIAYAVNGFYIKKEKNKFILYQRIRFDTKFNSKKHFTTFYIFSKDVKIPDRLIRYREKDRRYNDFDVFIIME